MAERTYYYVTDTAKKEGGVKHSLAYLWLRNKDMASSVEEFTDELLGNAFAQKALKVEIRPATEEETETIKPLATVLDAMDESTEAEEALAQSKKAIARAAVEFVHTEVTTTDDLKILTTLGQRTNVAQVQKWLREHQEDFAYSDEALEAVWTAATLNSDKLTGNKAVEAARAFLATEPQKAGTKRKAKS